MAGGTIRAAVGVSLVVLAVVGPLSAGEPEPTLGEIRAAAVRSLALIEASTAITRDERVCFTCHHQALPTLTLAEARRRGFAIDDGNFQQQLRHTFEHLERGRESYVEGRGQGGKADTAGYALWTLEAGEWKPDETTAAVTAWLLDWQQDLGRWKTTSHRPPSEASSFTTTYLALRGLSVFGADEQHERIAVRRQQALHWLLDTEPEDTEDRVFRLRALNYLGANDDAVRHDADELLAQQRDDGGWSQTAELASDAYATGAVLVALHEAGRLPAGDAAYRRGLKFLLAAQLEDGSWRVTSRSKPFQEYFESGYPHGKDQFISITAGSWATQALLLACPPAAGAGQSTD